MADYVTQDYFHKNVEKFRVITTKEMDDMETRFEKDILEVKARLSMHELKHEKFEETLTSLAINIQKLVSHAENEERNFPVVIQTVQTQINALDKRLEGVEKSEASNSKKIWYATGAVGAITFLFGYLIKQFNGN